MIVAALGILIFSACNESEDLVTQDAKTGGLVVPTGDIAYLLNATPKVDIALNVLKGPGVQTVEVYSQYISNVDTTESNVALIKTIDVALSNSSGDLAKDYSVVYTDLIKGLTLNGKALPTNENLLPLGDNFLLSYVSVLEDGSRVVNNAKTKIAIANQWTGSYSLSYYILRAGDSKLSGNVSNVPWKLATAGKKSVIYWKIHTWADGSTVGGIGPWLLTIDDSAGQTKPMPVTVTDAVNPAVKNNPAYDSHYDPIKKTFYISVYWGNGPTHRAAVDTLVYSGDRKSVV